MTENSPLLLLGLLMTTGLLFNLLLARVKVPRIASYALAGVIWSPSLLGQMGGIDMTSWSASLTDTALAIVAYIIGGSMTVSQLRKLGKSIIFLTLGQVLGALLVVSFAFSLYFGFSTDNATLAFILAMGVLATSTDPAATVAVVHQYRAVGPLTTILLGIAALDDAIGIILFSLLLVFSTGTDLNGHLNQAVFEISAAIGVGSLIGYLLATFGHKVKSVRFFLPMVLAALFLGQGMADWLGFSPLLTAMFMGFVARATFTSGGERLFASLENLEELVFLIFFTLAGTHFDLSILTEGIVFVLIYVFARIWGKVLGSWLIGRICLLPKNIPLNAGIGAIPQAGIAIGMALTLVETPQFSEQGILLLNVVLTSTLIFEIIGPLAAKTALTRAGELTRGESP